MTDRPYQRFIDLYRSGLMLQGGHSGNDLVYLMVMAQEPDRAFRVADFVQMFGHSYAGAWKIMRRLELTGLVLGGKLNDRGRAALLDDPDPPDPPRRPNDLF